MGACETCHVSMMTLKNGVEVAVKNAVPKVKKVVEVSSQNWLLDSISNHYKTPKTLFRISINYKINSVLL